VLAAGFIRLRWRWRSRRGMPSMRVLSPARCAYRVVRSSAAWSRDGSADHAIEERRSHATLSLLTITGRLHVERTLKALAQASRVALSCKDLPAACCLAGKSAFATLGPTCYTTPAEAAEYCPMPHMPAGDRSERQGMASPARARPPTVLIPPLLKTQFSSPEAHAPLSVAHLSS
jgi:hypothetical protein